jgi:hypothetical protein
MVRCSYCGATGHNITSCIQRKNAEAAQAAERAVAPLIGAPAQVAPQLVQAPAQNIPEITLNSILIDPDQKLIDIPFNELGKLITLGKTLPFIVRKKLPQVRCKHSL